MSEHLFRIMNDLRYRKKLGIEALEDFKLLKEYDLKNAWENIFKILEENNIESPYYYDPNQLPNDEKYIMSDMFSRIIEGFDNIFLYNRDYKIGHKLLYIPRKIKNIVTKR